MKRLAQVVVLSLFIAVLALPAGAQDINFEQFNFVTEATSPTSASNEFGVSGVAVDQALDLANKAFMAMNGRNFGQAIPLYQQAASLNPKYNQILEYAQILQQRSFEEVGEMKLPSQWGPDHTLSAWQRVKVKFWLGWFKSVLPQDGGMGNNNMGDYGMNEFGGPANYNSIYQSSKSGQPQPTFQPPPPAGGQPAVGPGAGISDIPSVGNIQGP